MQSSKNNNTPGQDKGQARPRFDWPALQQRMAFFEKEGVCYLPAGWGRKNPSLDKWEEYQTRLPAPWEKAQWFQKDKATNIGVVCGGISRGLVILCFNDPNGAREFFGEERWQKLPQATFVSRSVRGHHVWLRSDTPIKSQKVGKGKNESWLEIRSDGNFTVAPPSLHPDGVLYQAIGIDRIHKPDDLASFIVKRLVELGLRDPLRPKEVTGRRKIQPPCLEIISQGVDEQQRDAAALALARHYLIQFYKPEEVLWLLQEWDTKNKPPLNDAFFLESRIRAAENYQGYFCSLVKDRPTVATFCAGEEKCDWLKKLREGMSKPSAKEKPARSDEFNELAIEKLLENCPFIQHCRDNAANLSEPWWWSMVHILAVFGEPGRKKIHELSKPYPSYSEEETEQKIKEALKAAGKEIGPHTCAFIEEDLGFSCPETCQAKSLGVKSPAGLAYKLARAAGLPIIIVTNRFLREKTADTIAAVEQANIPPQIFERSGHIVRITYDEFEAPYIETLTESACRGFIERAASYVRVNAEGETIPLPAPPLDIVRDFMSLPNRNLPALLAITEVPVLRSDGSIVTEPGYDEATHLYYQPAVGLNIPAVPDNPSQKQLEAAVALIQEPVIDFPFDSEASRASALAVMVTPIYRPMITGPVPLCLIDKPQPGTGAGLLADVIAIIATGRPAAMMAPPKNDEECEKRLTSILRHGRAVITIDNMDGYLYFASLAMILTATTVQTRILGQSEELLLPNRATYIVTGNNVRLAGDLPRRCYLSRMDAREARPWLRDPKSFKYQHLIQWVRENRGELLAAILTMARAWIQAGKPIPGGLPPLGGFEDWTNIVGGILAYAGIRGFLGNLEFMYSQSDVETAEWENFLAAWKELFDGDMVTVAEVIKAINDYEDFAGALPDIVDRDPKKINRSLARALSKRAGVRYPNDLMITKSDKVVHHAAAWQVFNFREGPKKGELENPKFDDLDTKGELRELATPLRSYPSKSRKEEEIYEYGVKPNSPNSLLDTKRGELAEDHGLAPVYPTTPCPTCGCPDYWLTDDNRWLCTRCHPKPREIDMEI